MFSSNEDCKRVDGLDTKYDMGAWEKHGIDSLEFPCLVLNMDMLDFLSVDQLLESVLKSSATNQKKLVCCLSRMKEECHGGSFSVSSFGSLFISWSPNLSNPLLPSFGSLYMWKWRKWKKICGAKCKFKYKKRNLDIWKWPKRKKIVGIKCRLRHGKWEFDIWKWPNRKRKKQGAMWLVRHDLEKRRLQKKN